MSKLLIINITCNQGSTGKISEQVGLMMKERGWDVYLAHGARRVNPSKLTTYQFSTVKDEYLHYAKSLLLDGDGLGSSEATKRLINYIKEIQPDIIQLHNLHGYFLNYKILFEYLNSTNIPVVMTMHDCWSFTGHCVHPVIADCNRWKTGCYDCPLKTKYPKATLGLDGSKRNYSLKKQLLGECKNLHIVTVSDWLGSWVKQSILKQRPLHVIKNGIDLQVFYPYGRKSDGILRILGVSNVWHKDKGIKDVVELRSLLPNDKYSITLVGLNEKQVKQLPEGINGITRTSNQEELARLYSESDVLINPTYADTFPTVNLEAIACGTPVVTYRTGGSPESLTPETGIVVGVGDVKAMAAAITQMKESPLSSYACRDYALEYFDKDKCFEKYIELYNRILEDK